MIFNRIVVLSNFTTSFKHKYTHRDNQIYKIREGKQNSSILTLSVEQLIKEYNLLLKEYLYQMEEKQEQKSPPYDISSQNQKILSIPDPVSYKPIQFYDEGQHITYTDCWEISVLRFLHLVFGKGEIIDQQKLIRYMDLDNQNCKNLLEYFKANPTYKMDAQFYTTKQGLEIRSLWCQFLNNSRLFRVNIQGKYEVAATVPNLLLFFKGFFPKINFKMQDLKELSIQTLEDKSLFRSYQKILNEIYEQLSFDFKIKITIESNYNSFYSEFIYLSSVQNIYLDGQNLLEWEILQVYDIKGTTIVKRQSGHSDYRYPLKQK